LIMKNLGIKFKIAINSMFIFTLTLNAVELFVKLIMLDMGKIKSIDYQVGWGDAAWLFWLFIILICYCAEDLIDAIKSLKGDDATTSEDAQELAAVMYQVGGVYNLPENVMDVLSMAQRGEDYSVELSKLLPIEQKEKQ